MASDGKLEKLIFGASIEVSAEIETNNSLIVQGLDYTVLLPVKFCQFVPDS